MKRGVHKNSIEKEKKKTLLSASDSVRVETSNIINLIVCENATRSIIIHHVVVSLSLSSVPQIAENPRLL